MPVMQRTERAAQTYDAGNELPAITKQLTQEKIDRYAEASGDHNPLHTDPAFAARTQFGGTIAHGMLVLAYISEMMTAYFGEAWLSHGRLKVRFRGAARPGDMVTASGRITNLGQVENDRDGLRPVVCEVYCRNQDGEVLISGEATVGHR
jgi:3-hydroxybutyryl-CoA dehydratase